MSSFSLFYKHLKHAIHNALNPVPPPECSTVKYSEFKHKMKTGDIIAIAKGYGVNGGDKIFGRIISRLTGYEIYHIATIMVGEKRWFALEAIMPRVYLNLLSNRTPFYHIAVPKYYKPRINVGKFKSIAYSYLGKPYSLIDVLNSYWSDSLNESNGVTCTELVNNLLTEWIGVNNPGVLIPGEYVELLESLGFEIHLVIPD